MSIKTLQSAVSEYLQGFAYFVFVLQLCTLISSVKVRLGLF